MSLKLSPGETVLVTQILNQFKIKEEESQEGSTADTDPSCDSSSSVCVEDAFTFFQRAELSNDVLRDVLSIAGKNEEGCVERRELGVIVRLIGWAQIGVEVSWAWVDRCGPTAVIPGLPVLNELECYRGPKAGSSIRCKNDDTCYPPFSPEKKAEFVKLFLKNEPVDGILHAQRVWSVFVLSKLPWLALADIWDIADTDGSGGLTMTEFLIAMYFVDGLISKKFATLPSSIPSHIYEQAVYTLPDLQQHIYYVHPGKSRRDDGRRWGISVVIRVTASAHTKFLDLEGTGQIRKDAFMSYLYEQCFPSSNGEKIWKLVNILEKPTISQDEYAVALFLLHRNLVGIAIPKSLPSILIPPSIRSHPLFRCSSDIEAWDPKLDAPTGWDISGSIASRIFSFLDLKSRGFIKRDAIISLMKESKLPVHDLAQIWKLTNLGKKNRITLHLLAVVLFFLHWKLAGMDLPDSFPDVFKNCTPPLLSSDAFSSVQERHILTTENQQLRVSSSQNGTPASTSPSTSTAPARSRRPLPVPGSVPLPKFDASRRPGWSLNSDDSHGSTITNDCTAASDSSHSELDQLRSTIQLLMAENVALRNVIQVRGREGNNSLRASTSGDVPPPPYEDWISSSVF